jgi:hypothetical protein
LSVPFIISCALAAMLKTITASDIINNRRFMISLVIYSCAKLMLFSGGIDKECTEK